MTRAAPLLVVTVVRSLRPAVHSTARIVRMAAFVLTGAAR